MVDLPSNSVPEDYSTESRNHSAKICAALVLRKLAALTVDLWINITLEEWYIVIAFI